MRSIPFVAMVISLFTSAPLFADLPLNVDNVFGQPTLLQSDEIVNAEESNVQAASLDIITPPIAPPMPEKADDNKEWEAELADDDTDDLEKRLKELEKGWAKLDSAWETFQTAEKKKKSAAASKPTFKLNGRIHADYWDFVNTSDGIGYFEHELPAAANYGDDPEDRFAFRRIRLEMKGDILETMLYRIQIDFNRPSTPEMKDVFLGFKELPGNQTLLIGNQKRPMGLDHLNSSRYNVFLERPFVVEAFNEDARRPGVTMYGHSDDESLLWTYGVYGLETFATDGRNIGDSLQLSANGRLAGSPWYDEASDGRGYFHWGLSGMVARPDGDADNADSNNNEARFRTRADSRASSRWLNTGRIDGASSYEVIGLESIFNVGPLQFVGEYQHNFLQRDGGSDLQFKGGYFYASYFLTGEHIPYSRKSGTIGRVKPFENFFLVDNCRGGHSTGMGAWNIALRYNYLDLTDDNIRGGVGQSLTGALNWHWTPYSKVQFNMSYGDIRGHEAVNGFTSGNYFIIGTRFAIEF